MTGTAASPAAIRHDFDEIARLSDTHGHGQDRYDPFLVAQVPDRAIRIVEIGCGLGRLAARLARRAAGPERQVIGVDLSPEMIARARRAGEGLPGLSFLCGDFLALDLGAGSFDCVISAATLHHMDAEPAIARMNGLLTPGGRLIVHDLRVDEGPLDGARALCALAPVAFTRLLRTGNPRSPRSVREAWARHGAGEAYLTFREARSLAARRLPGARVVYHWLWRYTIVWDKPLAAGGRP